MAEYILFYSVKSPSATEAKSGSLYIGRVCDEQKFCELFFEDADLLAAIQKLHLKSDRGEFTNCELKSTFGMLERANAVKYKKLPGGEWIEKRLAEILKKVSEEKE